MKKRDVWGEDGDGVWRIIMFCFLVLAGLVYAYFEFTECTRVHPAWYCL